MKKTNSHRNFLSPYKIAVSSYAGIVCLLVLMQISLPHDVYFSGDAGIKRLFMDNLIQKKWMDFSMDYPASDIDPEGDFSPFRPPSMIKVKNNYFMSFPWLFSFAASFLLLPFGNFGPFLIPLAGTLLTLPAYQRLMKVFQIKIPPLAANICLLFSTPVMFYTLTLWEHTSAMFLFTWGILLIMKRKRKLQSIGWLVIGSAVFIRTEIAVGLFVAALLRFFYYRKNLWKPSITAAVIPLAALLFLNVKILGEPLPHLTQNFNAGFFLKKHTGFLSGALSRIKTSLIGMNRPLSPYEVKNYEGTTLALISSSVLLEFLYLTGAVIFIAGIKRKSGDKQRKYVERALVLIITIIGLHLIGTLTDAAPQLGVLKSGGIFIYFPGALFFFYSLLHQPDRRIRFYLSATAFILILTPLASPNHGGLRFGARYSLFAVPLLLCSSLKGFQMLYSKMHTRKLVAAALCLCLLGLSLQVRGFFLLRDKKFINRRFCEFIETQNVNTIISADHWIPFNLARTFYRFKFLKINSSVDLPPLLEKLLARNTPEFLLLSAELQPTVVFPDKIQKKYHLDAEGQYVKNINSAYFQLTSFHVQFHKKKAP